MTIEAAFGTPTHTIKFFRQSESYGYMSNFSPHPVFIDGWSWPTSEHWYQAMKFRDTDIQQAVRACRGPGTAAKMGRDRSLPMREDWDKIKDDVMRHVVLAKFLQNTGIKRELLNTNESIIIENSPYDSYWGCGRDGKGRNQLGVTLMWAREILNSTHYDRPFQTPILQRNTLESAFGSSV